MDGPRFVAILVVTLPSFAYATDWPMFRADAARSGYTQDAIPEQLQLRWVYQAAHSPRPAWPTRNRLNFDRAFQPIVAEGTLCFGSSVDDKVYALDAMSGELRWGFFTNAPVRFSPVAWRNRLFVASDDGILYCLSADNGQIIWKRRGGPRSDMLLGNDRMMSRWPARGGPLMVDDIVYFGAGIWPSEGIFLYALDAMTGEILWQNESSGSIEMDQPHSNARARSGLSAQGYLAANGDALLVPTGRAVPAILDRSDGALRQFRLQMHQHAGGADVVAIDEYFANGGILYATADGNRVGQIGLQAAVHPEYLVYATADKIVGLDRRRLTVERETVDRKGNKQQVTRLTSPAWEIEIACDADPARPIPEDLRPPEVRMNSTAWTTPILKGEAAALIVAADRVIVGGRGRVSVVDIPARARVWSGDVEGVACGLAAVDGRLYVSTDRGFLYCFDRSGPATPTANKSTHGKQSVDADSQYASAAEQILERSAMTDGCCVDLECGDGLLTLELARQSNLRIYAADPDPTNVEKTRERLDRAGLYGTRVTVHRIDSARTPYAEYCADLVVSGRSVQCSLDAHWSAEAERLQRPYGGVVCVGPADNMKVMVRGSLAGAGSWTHENSSPANTLCSDDRRLQGPLEMLWFRDTDFLMPNRHGRAPAPLVQNGRMFVEGLNCLRAQSIYNGRVLWGFSAPGILASYNREHSIGAAWTGGNVCLGPNQVFLHNGRSCFVLDTATGKEISRLLTPSRSDGKPGVWGYLAYHNGMLFGSLANEDYLIKCWSDRWDTSEQFTESILFFALDAATGKPLWSFTPQHSIRHNAIAIGGGRVYLIDRPVAIVDDLRYIESDNSRKDRRGITETDGGVPLENGGPVHPTGRLIALDERTGQPLWQSDEDVFGTVLAYVADYDLLWMGYQAAHQASRPSERANRMAVFHAADGRRRWDIETEYADRPVLNGRTVYAPPGAWNLLTGEKLPFVLERSYGCGTIAGCRSMLVFRSATLGYIDLAASAETQNYGGIRPGCWIAGIPAGGVLVMPDAASWCTCSYLNQGTIALRPIADRVKDPAAKE